MDGKIYIGFMQSSRAKLPLGLSRSTVVVCESICVQGIPKHCTPKTSKNRVELRHFYL